MRLVLDAKGFEMDALLQDFIRTTIVSAVWNLDVDLNDVVIRLERESDEERVFRVNCGLCAETPSGLVAAGGSGGDVWEAVQDAANRLEVELHRSIVDIPQTLVEDLLAA